MVTVLASPVIPASAQKLWEILGGEGKAEALQWDALAWGQLPKGGKVEALPEAPLFPRLKAEEVIPRMRELEQQISVEQARMVGKDPEPAPTANVAPLEAEISIDDFAKVDIRVGRILQAEPVPKADKLLHLKIDLGEAEARTILAGLALHYTPEDLVGRKVLVAANLAPRKLRGIESNGMVLAASLEGGKPVLAGFLEEVPVGARLK